jgi:hypothetical protein
VWLRKGGEHARMADDQCLIVAVDDCIDCRGIRWRWH